VNGSIEHLNLRTFASYNYLRKTKSKWGITGANNLRLMIPFITDKLLLSV
jgi:hypothetical protein